jgi:hypothetical protein
MVRNGSVLHTDRVTSYIAPSLLADNNLSLDHMTLGLLDCIRSSQVTLKEFEWWFGQRKRGSVDQINLLRKLIRCAATRYSAYPEFLHYSIISYGNIKSSCC